jgi:hypothetical protein
MDKAAQRIVRLFVDLFFPLGVGDTAAVEVRRSQGHTVVRTGSA